MVGDYEDVDGVLFIHVLRGPLVSMFVFLSYTAFLLFFDGFFELVLFWRACISTALFFSIPLTVVYASNHNYTAVLTSSWLDLHLLSRRNIRDGMIYMRLKEHVSHVCM